MQKRRIVDLPARVIVLVTLEVSLSVTGFLTPGIAAGRPPQVDLKDEHDPAKRSERFLEAADAAFDGARAAYAKDDVHAGDARLDEMMSALQNCVAALGTSHKSRLYKRAEMRVASLQRRMQSLLDEISITQRGWADQTGRKLEEVHDKLLEGAMKK